MAIDTLAILDFLRQSYDEYVWGGLIRFHSSLVLKDVNSCCFEFDDCEIRTTQLSVTVIGKALTVKLGNLQRGEMSGSELLSVFELIPANLVSSSKFRIENGNQLTLKAMICWSYADCKFFYRSNDRFWWLDDGCPQEGSYP